MSKAKKLIIVLIISFIIFCILSVLICYWVYSQNIPDVKIPGITVKTINYIEDLNLFEVIGTNNTLFYLTKDGRYAVFGNIIDTKTMKNITDEKRKEIFKVDFKTLPLSDAVKIGSGKNRIAVFSSPFCPWCRKLHEELKNLNDYSIYVFLTPFGDTNILKTMLCMNDTNEIIKAYSGNIPKAAGKTDCERANVLQRNGDLMRKNNISGLPTIVLENGKVINGYVKAEKIKEEASK